MQDIDGSWLEPHRDIPEKLFSMTRTTGFQ
jgi:hypothetical protein